MWQIALEKLPRHAVQKAVDAFWVLSKKDNERNFNLEEPSPLARANGLWRLIAAFKMTEDVGLIKVAEVMIQSGHERNDSIIRTIGYRWGDSNNAVKDLDELIYKACLGGRNIWEGLFKDQVAEYKTWWEIMYGSSTNGEVNSRMETVNFPLEWFAQQQSDENDKEFLKKLETALENAHVIKLFGDNKGGKTTLLEALKIVSNFWRMGTVNDYAYAKQRGGVRSLFRNILKEHLIHTMGVETTRVGGKLLVDTVGLDSGIIQGVGAVLDRLQCLEAKYPKERDYIQDLYPFKLKMVSEAVGSYH